MTGNELLKFTQQYIEEFPKMADNDIIVTIPRSRRVQGDFFKRFKITSIGMYSLVAKDSLNLGVEQVS